MATRMTLDTPRDYLLHRDVCSYGYFLLTPNHWEPAERTFRTTVDLENAGSRDQADESPDDRSAVTLIVRQPVPRSPSGSLRRAAGAELDVEADRALSKSEQHRVAAMLTRMLRLDETHRDIASFHKVDPRWAGNPSAAARGAGRGRLMRSATFFEDVIKTVTSCNVTWPSTIHMNAKLCRFVGACSASGYHAFPTPRRLARVRAATLRARCSVGYRDQRIVELARIFAAAEARGGVETGLSHLPDDELFERLQDWPGIGPYAAANIMQLMGRYSRLPLDTESVRHGRTVLGWKGTSAAIMKRLHRHFDPFGEHKFRAYWFELWEYYERQRGPAWTWERETTGKSFTAAQFARELGGAKPTARRAASGGRSGKRARRG